MGQGINQETATNGGLLIYSLTSILKNLPIDLF